MREADFTQGSILRPLLKFIFPIMLALLLQSLYGAADLLIVGQFSDAANVSAVSIGSQLMLMVTFVITDLSLGTTVLLGQFLGQRREQDCGKVIGSTIILFAIIGILVTIVMQPLAKPIAMILNAPTESLPMAVKYTRICCGGAIFIIAYNVLGATFRGIGNSKMPLITVAIAAVCNVFGDLLLVAVLHMGASGAAIATVAAQAISVLISFVIIRRSGLPFTFHLSDIRFRGRIIWNILMLGLPIALQDLLVQISFLIIMAIINQYGVDASAGIGVGEKICGFSMLVPSSFSQAMSSFAAQNYGAKKMDRAYKALRYAISISFACGVVIGYFTFFHGVILSRIFSNDPKVCLAAAQYLKGYAVDCLMTAFLFCFIGFFNGCGKTRFVMIQGIVGAFCVRIPFSYLFSSIQPPSIVRISLATPCSTFVQIILCLSYLYFVFLRKERKE